MRIHFDDHDRSHAAHRSSPITPRGSRRAWGEPPVRLWMILSILLLIGVISMLADNVPDGLRDRRLIYHGTPATAVIKEVNSDGDPRHFIGRDGEVDRTIRLQYPGGPADGAVGTLQGDEHFGVKGLHPGQSLDIRFDPNAPAVWTDRTEPLSWAEQMPIVWMLLPALIITGLMVVLRRRQMLRIWRDGEPIVATVIDARQSPIAPRSRLIRFTIEDSADRRVRSTFLPNSVGQIAEGDQIMMLALLNDPSRAIIAGLYE